jgi:MFS family permease
MSTTTFTQGPAVRRRRVLDWERIRFAACMAFYGATIGGCAILVNFLSRAQFPDVPEHMGLGTSLFFASAGGFAGAVMTAPLAYWLYGGLPTFAFTPHPKRGPRSVMAWALFGFGYGLALPLILGILLPVWFRFFAFYGGAISMVTLASSLIDLTIGSLYLAPLFGFEYFFTSLVAGVLFAVGALVIDLFNSSKDRATAKYGSLSMTIGLSVLVVILLVVVPETSLARLG